jgi:hypothetical protein
MVGSACFALGALPGYVSAVGAKPDGVTFFVGSLLFTAAAATSSGSRPKNRMTWRGRGPAGGLY